MIGICADVVATILDKAKHGCCARCVLIQSGTTLHFYRITVDRHASTTQQTNAHELDM